MSARGEVDRGVADPFVSPLDAARDGQDLRDAAAPGPHVEPVGPDLALMLAQALDRSSAAPLYHQVAERLRSAILTGELPAGTRLENEVSLAQRLGLSRPTVRQALQDLVDRGLLVRRRGIGTQVVQPQVNRPMALTSLHDDLAQSGREPVTRLLSHATGPAPARVAATMGLAPGTVVLTLRRLRFASGEPLAVMTNHVPTSLGLDPDELGSQGLYACLRARGVNLRVAHQRVGARLATVAEARLLGERPRAALVTMERTAFDAAGVAVEHGDHVYRASRYHVETTLVER